MSDESNSRLSRRTAIKGIATTAILGGGGIAFAASTAAAGTVEMSSANAGITSMDGSVTEVTVDPAGTVSWENFDEAVTGAEATIESRIVGETGFETVDRTPQMFSVGDGGLSGSVSHGGGYPLALYSGDDASTFESGTDGETVRKAIEIRLTVTLLNSDDEPVAPTDKSTMQTKSRFSTVVKNEAASRGLSATLDTDIASEHEVDGSSDSN